MKENIKAKEGHYKVVRGTYCCQRAGLLSGKSVIIGFRVVFQRKTKNSLEFSREVVI